MGHFILRFPMIAQEFLSNIAQQSLLSNTLLSNDFPIIDRSLLSNVAQQLLPSEMDVEEIKPPGKAVDLNDKQKSILAEVVKKRSAIWDAKDPDYKKKAVENWMDVADEFEQRSGSKYAHQDLQKAWKSITTYHSTVKNKVKSASGVAAKDNK
uniref:MADF domain-containing protein n=2 Tax=Ditylenchus dipsaci TaxID=166011 RepID=A0A915EMQ6_9BILA